MMGMAVHCKPARISSEHILPRKAHEAHNCVHTLPLEMSPLPAIASAAACVFVSYTATNTTRQRSSRGPMVLL